MTLWSASVNCGGPSLKVSLAILLVKRNGTR
jgi:hypothetical protein